MKKVRVYISCALTHAPLEYKLQIAALKDELQKIPWIEILHFVSALKGEIEPEKNSLHIYTNDIYACIGTAHAVIAEITLPSTGLGWELGVAVENHSIRTIMSAREGSNVSHLPRGAALHQNNGHVTFHWYKKSPLELLPYFLEELKKLHEE